jgi:hypothetical protein
MENGQNYSEDIKTIKKIMEESSRFLSLSGLSGLFTGLIAILGGCIAQFVILKTGSYGISDLLSRITGEQLATQKLLLFADAAAVLILALIGSLYFSFRKAKLKVQKIWTPVSRRMLLNLSIPLISGAFFILIFYLENQWQFIIPSMLVFYGLALIGAGKFTYSEVFYLGIAELLTGFLSAVFQEYSVFFWIFGFGFLHIGYGLFMYRKYEG